jgi:hypothetical protein
MRVTLISLLVVPPLAACNIRQADQQTHAAQVAADNATCAGYGFKKDTPEFANCLTELDETHKGYAIASQRAASQAAINQDQPMIQSATPHATTCTQTSSGMTHCY